MANFTIAIIKRIKKTTYFQLSKMYSSVYKNDFLVIRKDFFFIYKSLTLKKVKKISTLQNQSVSLMI